MAEAIFRDIASQHFECAPEKLREHGFDVLSAGVSAADSQPASLNSVAALKERGIDLSQHLSQQVTDRMVEGSDKIYAMTNDHLRLIQEARPDLSDRMQLLSSDGVSVIDPYGRPLDDYRACAEEITKCLNEIWGSIIEKKDA